MRNDLFQQLDEIKKYWDNLTITEDFSGWGMPGLTKQLVSDSIGGLAKIAEELTLIENFEPDPVSSSYVQTVLISSLRAYVTQHVPSNPQPHLAGLLEQVEKIRNIFWRWIEKPNVNKEVSSKLTNELSEAVSQMKDASIIFQKLKDNEASIESSTTEVADSTAQIKSFKENIEAQHTESEQFHAKTKALHDQAKIDAKTISDLVVKFESLETELNSNKQSQQQLFDEFEASRDKVNRLLEDTNRATMSASFLTRKNELQNPFYWWIFLFSFSILGLTITSIYFIGPSIDSKEWYTVLTKLPLTIPLVWLGWFSAKQFGFTSRLREDYAYKVASAMAFEGYKREANETDPELKKKLLETAINHFADNPLRIFNGHENHGSPLQEILDRLSKDKNFIELIKQIIAKIKS
jgi:hypothetical protein